MRAVFLDTVGLLALWNTKDQWHAQTAAAFAELNRQPFEFVTTSFVLLECGNAAARTPFRADVGELWRQFDSQGRLIRPSEDEERDAWEAYLRGDAAQAGIVDQVSFVVMRRLGVSEVFSNDRHFSAAGFLTLF